MITRVLKSKESLKDYEFHKTDVLHDEEKKKIRRHKLNKAMRLGNSFKQKVKMTFKVVDYQYSMTLDAIVMAVGDQYVSLRGGKTIPVRSIESVEI